MLRASGEASGVGLDLAALREGRPGSTAVAGTAQLLELADAVHARDQAAIGRARRAVGSILGEAAAVDACAVAAAFCGNNIVTAATGCAIPPAQAAAWAQELADWHLG